MPARRRASSASSVAAISGSPPTPHSRRRRVRFVASLLGIAVSLAYLGMVAWHAVQYTQSYTSSAADPGLLPFALQLPGLGFDAPTELAAAAGMVTLFLASLALLMLPRPSPSPVAAAASPSAAARTSAVASPSPSAPIASAPIPAPAITPTPAHPHAHGMTLPMPPLQDVPPAEAELLVAAAHESDTEASTGSPFPSAPPSPRGRGAGGEVGQGVRTSSLPSPRGRGAGGEVGRGVRIFVSHSSADNAFGVRLTAYLREELGLDVFYDSDGGPTMDRTGGLLAGDDWQARIERELGERNTFVVILSPAALASQWVGLEVRTAFAQAVSIAGKVFIPVLHQPPSEVEVPLFMARYQWVAFAGRDERAAYDELEQAVRLGQSRLRQDAGADLERLGPPFDLGVLTPTDHFVGREQDLAWVLDHLQATVGGAGLASIAAANGFAGIGKSTLAWRAIQQVFAENRFPDGIAVVKCNELADPVIVLRRVLSRFDPQGREPDTADLDQLGRLAATRFQGQRALVVLDNVEPELPIAKVVAPLRTAGVALLLTSRQELPTAAVPPEASRMLNLLTPDQALELFAEYYGRDAAPDLTPSEQDSTRRIVKALGYHTLAVKLAATLARRRNRPLDAVAKEYEADPRLASGLKDGSEAVSVLLESSYGALPESGQKLLVALAAFPTADVGRRAVLAVAEALEIAAARDGLDAILDLHLAEPGLDETLTSEAADRERIRLHALVRGYAQALFDAEEPEPRDAARAAVASWYASYSNSIEASDIEPDEANITGALELAGALGDDSTVARLANGMKDYWRDHSRTEARERFLPLGLAAAQEVATAEGADREDRLRLARLQLASAELAQHLGRLDDAEMLLKESLPIHIQERDRRGEGIALSLLGDIEVQRGELPAAQTHYEQVLAIMREVKDRQQEGVALYKVGQVADERDDLDAAERYYREGLEVVRGTSDAANLAIGAEIFGRFLITKRGKHDEGCEFLQEAVRLYTQMGLEAEAEEARETARQLGCGG